MPLRDLSHTTIALQQSPQPWCPSHCSCCMAPTGLFRGAQHHGVAVLVWCSGSRKRTCCSAFGVPQLDSVLDCWSRVAFAPFSEHVCVKRKVLWHCSCTPPPPTSRLPNQPQCWRPHPLCTLQQFVGLFSWPGGDEHSPAHTVDAAGEAAHPGAFDFALPQAWFCVVDLMDHSQKDPTVHLPCQREQQLVDCSALAGLLQVTLTSSGSCGKAPRKW